MFLQVGQPCSSKITRDLSACRVRSLTFLKRPNIRRRTWDFRFENSGDSRSSQAHFSQSYSVGRYLSKISGQPTEQKYLQQSAIREGSYTGEALDQGEVGFEDDIGLVGGFALRFDDDFELCQK